MNNVIQELLTVAPDALPAWEKHRQFWSGEEAGAYNDIAVFAHHAVNAFAAGSNETVQRMFDVVELHFGGATDANRDLLVVGFIEDVQNIAFHRPFGSAAFIQFLGPLAREAWREIEIAWQGKSSLAEVIRSEKKRTK